MKKVDPPVRVISFGAHRKVIFLENPFLDYIGCLPSGKMVVLEAKETHSHLLPLARDGGLTARQVLNLRHWHEAGAVVGVLWKFGEQVKLLLWCDLEGWLRNGAASVPWEAEGRDVFRGTGWVLWDFLPYFAIGQGKTC